MRKSFCQYQKKSSPIDSESDTDSDEHSITEDSCKGKYDVLPKSGQSVQEDYLHSDDSWIQNSSTPKQARGRSFPYEVDDSTSSHIRNNASGGEEKIVIEDSGSEDGDGAHHSFHSRDNKTSQEGSNIAIHDTSSEDEEQAVHIDSDSDGLLVGVRNFQRKGIQPIMLSSCESEEENPAINNISGLSSKISVASSDLYNQSNKMKSDASETSDQTQYIVSSELHSSFSSETSKLLDEQVETKKHESLDNSNDLFDSESDTYSTEVETKSNIGVMANMVKNTQFIDLTDNSDEIVEIKDDSIEVSDLNVSRKSSNYFPTSVLQTSQSANIPNSFDVAEKLQSLNISQNQKFGSVKTVSNLASLSTLVSSKSMDISKPLNIVEDLQAVSMSENRPPILPSGDHAFQLQQLRDEIAVLKNKIFKTKCVLKSANLSILPDRGVRLQLSITENERILKEKEKKLLDLGSFKWVEVQKPTLGDSSVKQENGQYSGSGTEKGFPKFGFNGFQTYKQEKSLTVEALQQLHGSIESCPSEDTMAEDPPGLKKDVSLMPHQKHALAWIIWREKQKPRGGILADDMGLGKTLTMISLVLKCLQVNEEDDSDEEDEMEKIVKGETLIVCPASLLNQWSGEVEKRCKRGVLDVEVHHGQNRATKPRQLAKRDLVITSYDIVRSESGIISGKKGSTDVNEAKRGVLHKMKWTRVILDEAHIVRNQKSLKSLAVCQLNAKYRWALTGTPIQNKEVDLYALLKFLRCSPFDDYQVWRRWVDNKNAAGLKRLNTVMKSIMLRRTKDLLQEQGCLNCLPERKISLIDVKLDDEEFAVYEKVLVFSKTLFAQFLHQRAERDQLFQSNYRTSSPSNNSNKTENPFDFNSELAVLHKKVMNMPNIKTHQILVLLLRLRQICCHPGLIKAMLDEDSSPELDGIEDAGGLDVDLVQRLNDMTLKESQSDDNISVEDEVQEKILSLNNPVFNMERISAKMRAIFKELDEHVFTVNDKAVIVSQWTSMLRIMGDHLRKQGIKCETLSGAIPVKDRGQIVDRFNAPDRGPRVLLLSLTAGGVGLNLVGGNHLFLFDLHWNPQLELQACDRIYRVGQKKTVHIYKFVCQDTIEQRIKVLQDGKLAIASDILTGSMHKQSSKLSLDDLKMLFSM